MNLPRGSRLNQESGSGTVTALGIITALILMLALVHVLSAAAVAKGQAVRAADLAALAAADTARGLNSGDPCTVAEQVSLRNGAVLEDCEVGGDHPTEVRVSVSRDFDVAALASELSVPQLRAGGSARAGPPAALPQH